MKMREPGLGVGPLALGAFLAAGGTANATLDMQKKAKIAGFEATNCLCCHKKPLRWRSLSADCFRPGVRC
jgi:hypothetical protein